MQLIGAKGDISIEQGMHGLGIFLTQPVSKGEVSSEQRASNNHCAAQVCQFVTSSNLYSLRADRRIFGALAKLAFSKWSAQVIMSVPESAGLIVDYERGMQVPAEAWPRLKKGLKREDPVSWDILLVRRLANPCHIMV